MAHHIKAKYFPALLLTSSFVVEVCAIFFSVYGLTKLFSGAALAVGIMAVSLEFAKVISASYLYRYWKEIGITFKTYFTVALCILMMITSLGIYGFLSNAFQSSTLGLEKDIAKLTLQESEIARIKADNEQLKLEKVDLQKMLSNEMSGLSTRDTSKRYLDASYRSRVSQRYQPLIKEKDNEISANNKKIEQLSQNITDSKVQMIDTGADVGPIIFVSKAFGLEISTVVQWLILLFIIVFDPLALALIIAFNKIVMQVDDGSPKSPSKVSKINSEEVRQRARNLFNDWISKQPTSVEQPVSQSVVANTEPPKETKKEEIAQPTPEPEPVVPQPKEDPKKYWPQPMQTGGF